MRKPDDDEPSSFEALWGHDPYLCPACGRALQLPAIERRSNLPSQPESSSSMSPWALVLGAASAGLLLMRLLVVVLR
ncbi:MAG: hypothetical protein R3C39_12940 [Dehalococcoidia bacterium]